ncbi:MAG: TetR/AcrR family transcriptional regulator [Elusimicrobia bacterium]|nr:TetR/AcrR family transcriptional regulator [Elusimicrobiota bacterium]
MSRRPNAHMRERILKSAYELFYKNGFKGVSMDDVASAAGVKKANLFHYYPTKEALGLAVLSHGVNGQKEMVMSRFSHEKDPIKTLEEMFVDAASRMQKNGCCRGCFIGNFAQELSDQNEKLRKKISEYFHFWTQQVADYLERWQMKGYFKKGFEPREAAEGILASFEGAFLFCKANKQLNPIHNTKKMVGSYLKGFRA